MPGQIQTWMGGVGGGVGAGNAGKEEHEKDSNTYGGEEPRNDNGAARRLRPRLARCAAATA